MSAALQNREQLWLPLLKRLTREVDSWAVWKRADPAFTGPEDVDAVAPIETWPRVEQVFRDWARESGFPVVVCRHIPRTLNLFALVEDGRSLLQLEVKDRATFRGSVQFTAADLLPLTHLDSRGFRTLRPGAEGVLKLTLHGLRRGGRPNNEALAEHGVVAMLRSDPETAAAATAVYGWGRRPLLRAVRAAAAGHWDRRAMLTVEFLAVLRALFQPQVGASRFWFRRVVRPRCPVLQTVYTDQRRILGDPSEWLAEAARAHPVVRPGDSAPTSGRFVVLVGPDGVGKTTVARALIDRHDGPVAYVYFRPPLHGSLPRRPPTGPRPRGNKYPRPQPRVLGWLRLLKNIVWFWVGYLRVIRPMLRAGGLVVGDRWAYGYPIQPGPLAFFGPEWLARLGVQLMPQPHLIANLAAPPDIVAGRKDELTAAEIARELVAWRELPIRRLVTFDAQGSPDEVAARIIQWMDSAQSNQPTVWARVQKRLALSP